MKYVLAALGFVLAVVIVVVLLIGGGGSKPKTSTAIKLSDYSTKSASSFEYLVDGPINAEENHRSIRVTITPTNRTAEVISGYNGSVLKSKTYSNNTEAYTQFVDAMAKAGFARSKKNSASNSAVCPTGTRYQYKLVDDKKDIVNTWSASCNSGTFGGEKNMTRNLFRAQIPDYDVLTQGVYISSASI